MEVLRSFNKFDIHTGFMRRKNRSVDILVTEVLSINCNQFPLATNHGKRNRRERQRTLLVRNQNGKQDISWSTADAEDQEIYLPRFSNLTNQGAVLCVG
jgi:hypothetical protein